VFQEIPKLKHYNTPGNCTLVVEGIVHPSSNTGSEKDRLPHLKYYHRDRHGLGNTPKSAPRHRGSINPDWCSHEHRQGRCQGRVALDAGTSKGALGIQ